MVCFSNQPAKKGVDLCRVMAEADPEGCRYAAARRTGIPILRALSIILFVMPEPGKATRPFGRQLSKHVVTPEGRGLAVPVPIRLANDLVDAVLLRPACRDLLRAGSRRRAAGPYRRT